MGVFPAQAIKHLTKHSAPASTISGIYGQEAQPLNDPTYDQVIAYINVNVPRQMWRDWLTHRANKIRDCTSNFCELNRGNLYQSIIDMIDAKNYEAYANNPLVIIRDAFQGTLAGIPPVIDPLKSLPLILIVGIIGYITVKIFFK